MTTDRFLSPSDTFVPSAENVRRVYIKTYGCQMNVYDSQRMLESLVASGYTITDQADEADLILVNTCHIREKASEKLYSDLGRWRVKQQERANKALGKAPLTIGVTGCVAQAEGEEILRRAPVVDFVLGPQVYHRLPAVLDKVAQGQKVIDIDYAVEDKFAHLVERNKMAIRKRGVSAFLTVQEGCDKFCTFCVVPYTRGAEISRSREQILHEAEKLAAAGVREITLLGQNVNAWHGTNRLGKPIGLAGLLYELAEIKGLLRLRYTTSHPRDMNEALIQAHGELPVLMPYLHLPVQSGSDKILQSMNRQHSAHGYLTLIERIRKAQPDMAFSGDFIVGFPGETEEDFRQTLALIKEVAYSSAYSFKYSARPGTPGAQMADQVAEEVKDARLQELQALLALQQENFLKSKIGARTEILLEGQGRHEAQMRGRSPWLFPVAVPLSAPIGTLVPIRIEDHGPNSFIGTPIDEPPL